MVSENILYATNIMFIQPLILTAPLAFYSDVTVDSSQAINGGSLFSGLKGLYKKGKRVYNHAKNVVDSNPLLRGIVNTGLDMAKANPLYATARNAYNVGDALLSSKKTAKQVASPYIAQAKQVASPYIEQASPYMQQNPKEMMRLLQQQFDAQKLPGTTSTYGYGVKRKTKSRRSKKKVLTNAQIRQMLMN